jgi:hypothetical protein
VVAIVAGRTLIAGRSTVPTILKDLKGPFGEDVVRRWKTLKAARVLNAICTPQETHRFWQPGGGFDRNVRSEEELWRETCYVHDNPVRRGLVERAEDWAWSSAKWYAARLAGEREPEVAAPIDAEHLGKWTPPPHWVRQAVEFEPRRDV